MVHVPPARAGAALVDHGSCGGAGLDVCGVGGSATPRQCPSQRSLTLKRYLVMGALALLLGQAGAAAASVGPSTTPGTMRPWSLQYMNGPRPVSSDQAVADAKAFNVIAAHATAYRPYVGAMKAANPDLKLFVYMKGVLTTDTNL